MINRQILLLVVGSWGIRYYRIHLMQQIRYARKLCNSGWRHLGFRTASEDIFVRAFPLTTEREIILETALQHQLLDIQSNNDRVLPAPSFPPLLHLDCRSKDEQKVSRSLLLHCSANTGQQTNLHRRSGHPVLIQRLKYYQQACADI